MIHIELDWDERDVYSAIAMAAILIGDHTKPTGQQIKYDTVAQYAHLVADSMMRFDGRMKRQDMLLRQLARGEITEDQFNSLKE